jgi:glycogen synthase
MKIALLTNEYPPHVYGGAGVHAEYLSEALVSADGGHDVQVICFGEQSEQRGRLLVSGVRAPAEVVGGDPRHTKFFSTLLSDVVMVSRLAQCDVIHCHTWYTHLAGCLARALLNVPLVLTTHSLEPHRPWKVEQLGTAYDAASWVERTAYQTADGVVAVSEAMRRDVHGLYGVESGRIRVIHNGIDIQEYRPTFDAEAVREHGIDPVLPYILFVGRITRQKGIIHLVRAIQYLRPDVQVALCAGAPDTPEIATEMAAAVDEARRRSDHRIVWIREMLPRPQLIRLYTHAAVFVCPSVYEPFGIINLEAMACETPVVASAVGGIPEVVAHGETGLLVAAEVLDATEMEPRHPEQFARDLAAAVNALLADPERRASMSARARARVVDQFSWQSIANQTLRFYDDIIKRHRIENAGHREEVPGSGG